MRENGYTVACEHFVLHKNEVKGRTKEQQKLQHEKTDTCRVGERQFITARASVTRNIRPRCFLLAPMIPCPILQIFEKQVDKRQFDRKGQESSRLKKESFFHRYKPLIHAQQFGSF